MGVARLYGDLGLVLHGLDLLDEAMAAYMNSVNLRNTVTSGKRDLLMSSPKGTVVVVGSNSSSVGGQKSASAEEEEEGDECDDDITIAITLNNLAMIELSRGFVAERHLQRSFRVQERLGGHGWRDSQACATLLNNVAAAAVSQAKLPDALRLFNQSLDIKNTLLSQQQQRAREGDADDGSSRTSNATDSGGSSVAVMSASVAHSNVGHVLQRLGRLDEALREQHRCAGPCTGCRPRKPHRGRSAPRYRGRGARTPRSCRQKLPHGTRCRGGCRTWIAGARGDMQQPRQRLGCIAWHCCTLKLWRHRNRYDGTV